MVFTGNYELSSSPEPSSNPALKPFNLRLPSGLTSILFPGLTALSDDPGAK